MKVLWLCNRMPGVIKTALGGSASAGGLWVDHVLSDLRQQPLRLHILCPGEAGKGTLDERCSYSTYREGLPYVYLPELEDQFGAELREFAPDVIHIWGSEYGHTLAMVNAAEKAGLLDHVAVSIQGLCWIYAGHYAEGVPHAVQHGATFRDLLRWDNIARQQKKFARRGELEVEALKKVRHVIGRTSWDKACTEQINPKAQYHFCNETLREPFYEGQWRYETCQRGRIFASSCVYPIKGFHYLLVAFAQICKDYPEATLAVPGKSFLTVPKLRRSGYQKYLAELAGKYGIADKIEFLGHLTAEQMKAEYLKANVFVLPSTIENSPNSLGEAMLLGVPCVSSDVGGVRDLLIHGKEGYVYQSAAAYMLAHDMKNLLDMGQQAEALGQAARAHAQKTHDPEKNLQDLLAIYESLA